jgi:hypothetical protein
MLHGQVLCLALAGSVAASLPLLSSPELLMCGAEPLRVDFHSSPFFGDWDGDGLGDLMVGQFQDGMIALYINTGTAQQPQYDSQSWLVADGEPIMLPYG